MSPKKSKKHSYTIGNTDIGDPRYGRISYGLAASHAFYWVSPAASSITMAVTTNNPAHLTMSMDFINNTWHNNANRSIYSINYSKIIKMVRILGLMTAISYMIVILFTWILANLEGYEYFLAGEPELSIKYTEWILGFTGIFAVLDCLRKELTGEKT